MIHLASITLLLLLAAPTEKGALRIVSQPAVEVIWEGVELGRTDSRGLLVIQEIPIGTYSVTLRKEGFRERKTRAVVKAGESRLSLKLKPIILPQAAEKKTADRPAPEAVPETGAPPQVAGVKTQETAPPDSASTAERDAEARPPRPAPQRAAELSRAAEPPADHPAPLEATEPAVTQSASMVGPWIGLLTLLALAVAATLFLRSRSSRPALAPVRSRAPELPREVSEPPDEVSEPPDEAETDRFLKELQQQEEHVRSVTKTRDGRQVVEVEVTDVEILEEEP